MSSIIQEIYSSTSLEQTKKLINILRNKYLTIINNINLTSLEKKKKFSKLLFNNTNINLNNNFNGNIKGEIWCESDLESTIISFNLNNNFPGGFIGRHSIADWVIDYNKAKCVSRLHCWFGVVKVKDMNGIFVNKFVVIDLASRNYTYDSEFKTIHCKFYDINTKGIKLYLGGINNNQSAVISIIPSK